MVDPIHEQFDVINYIPLGVAVSFVGSDRKSDSHDEIFLRPEFDP